MKIFKTSESAYRARVKEQIEGRKGVIDFESLGRTLAYSPFLPRLMLEDLARDSALGRGERAQSGGNEVQGAINGMEVQGGANKACAQGREAQGARDSTDSPDSIESPHARESRQESSGESRQQSRSPRAFSAPHTPYTLDSTQSHTLDLHSSHKGVSLPHIAFHFPIMAHDEPTGLLHRVSALESTQGREVQGARDSADSMDYADSIESPLARESRQESSGESSQQSRAPHAFSALHSLESPQATQAQSPQRLESLHSTHEQGINKQSLNEQATQARESARTRESSRPDMLLLDMRALYESESLDPTTSLLGLESISLVRRHSSLPIIHADIFIDPYQILESALFGSDALLLPARGLDSKLLRELLSFASRLGLECFVAVEDKSELKTAIFSGARMLYMADSALKNLLELVPNSQIIASDSTQEYGVDVWIRGV